MKAERALVLYDYWRSSAAYRVRIALHLKGLKFEQRPVHLLRGGGEQHGEAYRSLNPQGLVPLLVHGRFRLAQSLAIIEYLDETFGPASLLPPEPETRARVRSLAAAIACDIHPINNLRVQQRLRADFDASEEQLVDWMNFWVSRGFSGLERSLEAAGHSAPFLGGDQPGLADCCLVPQMYNARRYECNLSDFPILTRIDRLCRDHSAFIAAEPDRQPDAPGS